MTNQKKGLTSPSETYEAADLSADDILFTLRTPRALYVGGTGNIKVTGLDDVVATFFAVPIGTLLPISYKRLWKTGTTATLLIVMY